MKFILLFLLILSCNTVNINNSSGNIKTWDGNNYDFVNSTIVIDKDIITISKKTIINKKNVKTIYLISEDYQSGIPK